jgi:hypothetical protein
MPETIHMVKNITKFKIPKEGEMPPRFDNQPYYWARGEVKALTDQEMTFLCGKYHKLFEIVETKGGPAPVREPGWTGGREAALATFGAEHDRPGPKDEE